MPQIYFDRRLSSIQYQLEQIDQSIKKYKKRVKRLRRLRPREVDETLDIKLEAALLELYSDVESILLNAPCPSEILTPYVDQLSQDPPLPDFKFNEQAVVKLLHTIGITAFLMTRDSRLNDFLHNSGRMTFALLNIRKVYEVRLPNSLLNKRLWKVAGWLEYHNATKKQPRNKKK